MSVTLYANISANGKVLLSEYPNHQMPETIFEVNVKDIQRFGNLIMGSKSFATLGVEGLLEILPGVEMVVLSRNPVNWAQIHAATQPEEAIHHLKEKGFENVLVGGGTETYNIFLKQNLITDIVLNVLPLITVGGDWFAADELNLKFNLISHQPIGDGVIQLHYRR